MIGFFSDPYPDELFYSVCARIHRRSRRRGAWSTFNNLFGTHNAKVVVDFPSRLETVVAGLPPGHQYSADRLIDDNTLLPYYTPFQPPERIRTIRETMRMEGGGGTIHGRLGVLTSEIRVPFLRFCPVCVEADRQADWRETYWHRLHQAPGVEVCPVHEVFLQESKVPARTRGGRKAPVAAEDAVVLEAPIEVRQSDPSHRVFLRIARDVAWLLGQKNLTCEIDLNRNRYLRLLCDRGIANYTGVVRLAKLQKEFTGYYVPELLNHLRCGFQVRQSWLNRLVQGSSQSRPPLHHLLLMQFLDHTAEDFFRLPRRGHPFGDGPWPCLNRAAEHFTQPCVSRCVVSYSQEVRKRPIGEFACDCGFVYSRIGPDSSDADRRQIYKVKSGGQFWDQYFKDLFTSEHLGLKEIAERLGVNQVTAKKHAVRLGLINTDVIDRIRRQPSSSEMLEFHRRTWLKALESNSGLGRNRIGRSIPTVYNWLLKYDRIWFEENAPRRMEGKGPPCRIDWALRDSEMAEGVFAAAARLLGAAGRPVRASVTAVAREIGMLTTISKNKERLPKTLQALDEVAESIEAFAARRVRWAAEGFIRGGTSFNRWDLLRVAAVSPQVASLPQVISAIAAALSGDATQATAA